MARPQKIGLDYFPLDVAIDDNIELLEAECGLEGFAILIKLWQKIYSSGYFIEWGEDHAMLFARKINSEITTVNAVINSCFRRKLFNEKVFKKYKILTSKGIQKRFIQASHGSKRKSISMFEEITLVNSEYRRFLTELTSINSEESTQRKEDKRKENKSIVKDIIKVMDSYKYFCSNFSQPQKITDKRESAISARLSDYDLETVLGAIITISESQFLNDSIKTTWLNFDWIWNPNNFIKIIEGNYNKKLEGVNNGQYQRNNEEGLGEYEGIGVELD
jgi:hypothetical protein